MTLPDFLTARAAETYPEPPSPAHVEITAQMVAAVCADLPKGFSVLDVGCGAGIAFEHFRKAGAGSVTGISPNDEDVDATAEWCHQNDPGCYCSVGQSDMHDLEHYSEPEVFDLIWARHVLEHSIAPYYVLSEFHRILKPGGKLYAEMPAPDTACQHESNQNHYSVLGQRAWAWLLDKAKFEIVDARSFQLKTPAGPDVYFSFTCKKKAE